MPRLSKSEAVTYMCFPKGTRLVHLVGERRTLSMAITDVKIWRLLQLHPIGEPQPDNIRYHVRRQKLAGLGSEIVSCERFLTPSNSIAKRHRKAGGIVIKCVVSGRVAEKTFGNLLSK